MENQPDFTIQISEVIAIAGRWQFTFFDSDLLSGYEGKSKAQKATSPKIRENPKLLCPLTKVVFFRYFLRLLRICISLHAVNQVSEKPLQRPLHYPLEVFGLKGCLKAYRRLFKYFEGFLKAPKEAL